MKKHTVNISGHDTSVSLEPEFWEELKHLAELRDMSLHDLICEIDANRDTRNLSSALRLYILKELQSRIP
jgi:predicted DNA-binding ribbon-helix-helix protein